MKWFVVLFLMALLRITYLVACVLPAGVNETDCTSLEAVYAEQQIHNAHYWQLDFTINGWPVKPDTTLFMIEIFVNRQLRETIEGKPRMIQDMLDHYQKTISEHDEFEIILLNSQFLPLVLYTPGVSYRLNRQEVKLQFHPQKQSYIRVELADTISILSEYHFFYIEKSNGIKNLRDFKNRLDSVSERGMPFLVYYFGPSGEGITINHEASKEEIRLFLNLLFDNETQPPGPQQELLRVENALMRFLPDQKEAARLNAWLYISESSYKTLFTRLIEPLLSRSLPGLLMADLAIVILTDFDVYDKKTKYTYINIYNN